MQFEDLPEKYQNKILEIFQREWSTQKSSLKSIKAGKSNALNHQIAVYQRMDDTLQATRNLQDRAPACRSGCNYCCHYHIYVSATEAFAIAEYLHKAPESTKTLYLSRLKTNAAQAEKLGVDLHIKTNIRCAFLAEGGECSIYALRPGACRRHHSLDVTPCKATFEDSNFDGQNPQSPEHVAAEAGFSNASTAAAKHVGFDHSVYEMSGAILEAMTNPSSGKRWKAGKRSFLSVSDRHEMNG